MTQQKKMSTGKAIIVLIVIIFFVALAVYGIWSIYSLNKWAQEKINAGCTPLGTDYFGTPTTFSCPIK